LKFILKTESYLFFVKITMIPNARKKYVKLPALVVEYVLENQMVE